MIEPDPEPTMTSEEAWQALLSANQEQDLDDFKVFFLEYVRNNKELTFVDLEKKFREAHLSVYLIAIVTSPPSPISSLMASSELVLVICGSFAYGPCSHVDGRKRRSRSKRLFAICREKQAKNISFLSNSVLRIVARGTISSLSVAIQLYSHFLGENSV